MHDFIRLIQNTHHELTDGACEEIKQQFKFDDKRSEQISAFNAFWFQFWAHQCLNSDDGPNGKFNRYNGSDDGEGVYPFSTNSPLLEKGYFRTSEEGLPSMHFNKLNGDKAKIEIAVDMNRANENRVLKANHLMAINIHNKRMDAHGDYQLAKDETVSTLNRVTLNESLILCQMDECEFFDIKVENMHLSLEWNFAIARWAHAQMPETVHDEPLFQKGDSKDIDLKKLLLIEKARDMNLGVAPSMQKMVHLPTKPHEIIERTSARHLELKLGSYQDLADLYGMQSSSHIAEGCPIWFGMLKACEVNNGMPDELVARMLADGLAGSLVWGKRSNQLDQAGKGLWHPRWVNAPVSTADILDYAQL